MLQQDEMVSRKGAKLAEKFNGSSVVPLRLCVRPLRLGARAMMHDADGSDWQGSGLRRQRAFWLRAARSHAKAQSSQRSSTGRQLFLCALAPLREAPAIGGKGNDAW